MTIEDFHSLAFGDIIADQQGNEFQVLHALENGQGQTAYVAIVPALGDPVPTQYTIIRKFNGENLRKP